MHTDEDTRLSRLSEKLTHVVIQEADPDTWPGADRRIEEHSKQERGDRYWHKKNAAASLTLLIKIHSLIDMRTRESTLRNDDKDDADLDRQIREAEREATNIIARIHKKSA